MKPIAFALSCVLLTAALPVTAQEFNCAEQVASNPERRVFVCEGGLVLEAEAAAVVGIAIGSAEIAIERGGALAIVDEGRAFQIRMPHAIASVRGTVFAVDVSETTSSVFVLEDTVVVTRLFGAESVTLEAGQGVDVTDDARMEVNTWGEPRVRALLARFAR